GDHRREPPSEHGIEHAGGEGNADRVVRQGEEEVLPNVSHGRPRQVNCGDDAGERAGDQGDVGCFDSDVRAGPNGQPEVSGGDRRGVVDAVTDHADPAAFALQAADLVGLVLRQDFGDHSANAGLSGDGGCGAGIVAGEHDDVYAETVQGG